MKKATLVIIIALYVASIVVVGVFGMKAYTDESLKIKKIILPETMGGKKVTLDPVSQFYNLGLTYTDDLAVPIEFSVTPSDAPGRLTVETEIYEQSGTDEDPAAVLNSGILTFFRKGYAFIRIFATDGSGIEVRLKVFAL